VQIPPDALGFAVVVATFFGAAIGVKLLVWGKGPIRRLRGTTDPTADERFSEVEERVQQLAEFVSEQSRLLEEYHERLDFTERLLTQRQPDEPKIRDRAADGDS
jgi:hypothetical protein